MRLRHLLTDIAKVWLEVQIELFSVASAYISGGFSFYNLTYFHRKNKI